MGFTEEKKKGREKEAKTSMTADRGRAGVGEYSLLCHVAVYLIPGKSHRQVWRRMFVAGGGKWTRSAFVVREDFTRQRK